MADGAVVCSADVAPMDTAASGSSRNDPGGTSVHLVRCRLTVSADHGRLGERIQLHPASSRKRSAGATGGEPAHQAELPVSALEARATDLRLIAEAHGWSLNQATSHVSAAEVVGTVAVEVSKARPEAFVGSALSDTPGGAPTLYIKGPSDKYVNDLVARSGIIILVADNQPCSWSELEERKLQVVRGLEARGFRYIAAGADIKSRRRIIAAVAPEPGLPSTAAEAMAAVPSELRADVSLTVTERSAFQDTNSSFGGMMVTKSGANDATSGWTVGKAIGSTFLTGSALGVIVVVE